MIRHFAARHVGCLRDVQLPLTPLHALIGPNDSGKTTLLRAMGTLADVASRGATSFHQRWSVWKPGASVLEASVEAERYHLQARGDGLLIETFRSASNTLDAQPPYEATLQIYPRPVIPDILSGVRFIHFDPKQLRQNSGLIPENQLSSFFNSEGAGLPGVYQSILGRGDDAFQDIKNQLKELFPTVQWLRVPPVSADQLSLAIELKDGTRVPATEMSEGLLYFLAYAALQYLSPVSLLLIEEPENGLHPARIADVIKLLRKLSESGTQVVMATHSPLVINELQPDEVTVVTRPSVEQGTVVTPIKQTPNFEKRSSVYSLGELWLSYADGRFEEPLLKPPVQLANAGE